MRFLLKITAIVCLQMHVLSVFSAVNSPQINCVSVLSNGNVSITWQIPADPASEFVSYNIFSCGTLNGTYTQIGTINTYTTNSYTDVSIVATVSPRYYYITTTSVGSVTLPAIDTVNFLRLLVSEVSPGVALLKWDSISNPLPPGSSANYSIYREYPTGTYTLIGTTTGDRWRDTISDVCTDFLFKYYIEISDASGCTSISNVYAILLRDQTIPATPTLDSVSVDNSSNHPILGLNPSPSTNFAGYVIYHLQGTSFFPLDTVWSSGSAVYTDIAINSNSEFETYAIASVDVCRNPSVISIPKAQDNIYLKNNYTACGSTISLDWNKYNNMKGNLKEYKVYMSYNGGSYTAIGTIVGGINQPSFSQSGLTQLSTYKFFVRAINLDGSITSTSNIITLNTPALPQPSYVYIKDVTVIPDQNITIDVKVDSSETIDGIEVHKSLDGVTNFSSIGFIPSNGTTNYSITDTDVSTAETIYYYKAFVRDDCGSLSINSNTSKSILLTAVANSNKTNKLTWTNYSSYLASVGYYNIYRSVNGVFSVTPIAAVGATINAYTDNVIELVPFEGRFEYYVQAVEAAVNAHGVQGLSNSNIVTVYQTDSVFIPKAFVPNGVNKTFIPVIQYADIEEYKLTIFDRWGTKVWQTDDITLGWDGDKTQGGLYAYIVEYKNAFGEYKQVTGTVLMIK